MPVTAQAEQRINSTIPTPAGNKHRHSTASTHLVEKDLLAAAHKAAAQLRQRRTHEPPVLRRRHRQQAVHRRIQSGLLLLQVDQRLLGCRVGSRGVGEVEGGRAGEVHLVQQVAAQAGEVVAVGRAWEVVCRQLQPVKPVCVSVAAAAAAWRRLRSCRGVCGCQEGIQALRRGRRQTSGRPTKPAGAAGGADRQLPRPGMHRGCMC